MFSLILYSKRCLPVVALNAFSCIIKKCELQILFEWKNVVVTVLRGWKMKRDDFMNVKKVKIFRMC